MKDIREVTDNELIAEFMKNDAINSPHLMEQRQLEYNTSWDWLMPVVEECNNILIGMGIGYPDLSLFDHRIHSATIDEVYESVIEFIKWYNTEGFN